MSGFRYAFGLSKSEVHSAAAPGTVVLMDHELVRTQTGHHEYEENHIHLQPTPSPDPADPLNLPIWRKVSVLLLMGLYAFTTNVSSSVLSSALPALVTAFATFSPTGPPTGIEPFTNLTHLIAVNNLLLGASNVFWVPLGNTFGRRPVILTALLVLTAASIWCGEAKSYNSLLAARVIQGCGGGVADTLAPDVVGQVFFVHQRGRAMAIYTIFLASGSLVGGLIGGYITSSLGWRWTCYIPAIMAGALFVLTFFLVPETLFDREKALGVVEAREHNEKAPMDEKAEFARVATAQSQVFAPYSYARSLKLGTYRPGLIKRIFTPYTTLMFPGTWLVMLHYAGLVGLIVTISTVAPTLLTEPPYLWGANSGLINVGGLIGTVMGALYTYFTADWWVKREAKKDRLGFAEPERRLPLLFPGLIIATAGSLAFGFCAQNPSPKAWIGLEFGMGMVSFGLMPVPSIGFNYLIEAYGGWASDAFLVVVASRAAISFAYTFFVGNWAAADGYAEPFGIFAMLMGIFSLLTVPVWLYGKRFRIMTGNTIAKNYNIAD